MNVNKKLDRFKQWAGEKMGGEVKTNTSDDFKMLETEMTLRHEGMDRLHKSMNSYVKSMSKRNDVDDREKNLPVGHLGSTMVSHGEDFEPDSEFGNCLLAFGRANERIARLQETYVANATSTWLESAERSLAQMKEYQLARKKLEGRRLAYDTTLSKMQKAKKEDFRVEEELRSQKAKYEESSDDVYRRMQDIKEAEVDSVADLTSFLEAELAYYDRCREVLLQLKQNWPARTAADAYDGAGRKATRSRSNTAHEYAERFNPVEEEPAPEQHKLTIPRLGSRTVSSAYDHSPERAPARPAYSRSSTFEGPTRIQRDVSPAPMPRLTRVPTEPSTILANRAQLRPVKRAGANGDVFGDPDDDGNAYMDQMPSPATSYGSGSRSASWSTYDSPVNTSAKKGPPPPPPSRAKKPPPPPPVKRSTLSHTELAHG